MLCSELASIVFSLNDLLVTRKDGHVCTQQQTLDHAQYVIVLIQIAHTDAHSHTITLSSTLQQTYKHAWRLALAVIAMFLICTYDMSIQKGYKKRAIGEHSHPPLDGHI